MKFSMFRWSMMLGVAAATAGGNLVCAQEEEKETKSRFWVEVQTDEESEGEDGEKKAKFKYEVKQDDAPKYWIGIMLKSIEGDLAAHLDSDEGVFIESVAEKSPAEKAGVKKGDIVVKVDGKRIASLETMMDTMRKVGKKDKPTKLKLAVVRNGEDVTLTVLPEKRPVMVRNVGSEFSFKPYVVEELLKDGESEEVIEKLMAEVRSSNGEAIELLRLGQPKMLKALVDAEEGLEGNISIVVTRSEDEEDGEGENVIIKVEKKADDEKMKVTIDKDGEVEEMEVENLGDLPKEVREAVNIVVPKTIDAGKVRVLNLLSKELAEEGEAASRMEKALLMTKERVEAARAEARKAQAAAREKAVAAASRLRKSGNAEVDELKAMVEALRKEIKALKKELSDR